MYHSHALRLFALRLAAGVAQISFFASLGPAESAAQTASKRSMYHADPEHLWNRLHEALFVRVGPDGRTYGQDRLEPLLWGGSKHLLEDPSRTRAVALLEEFLKNNGEKPIDDPLKRTVLQRDLWLVFNWLEGDHYNFYEPELKPEEVRAARDRLRRPLAAVIARLALTPDQIKKLPDNYRGAVASGYFPKRFNPAYPGQPYLPPDLFAAEGPWVCVGRPDGPIAPEHLRDNGTNVFTNSAILVFLRLPAGRAATLDYLKRLRTFNQPLRVEAKEPTIGMKYLPNPNLPLLPVDTEVALVRRALLIASPNIPAASPLTESVQLRVYREVPQITTQSLRTALDGGRAQTWQTFHEFRLSRSELFAGRAGGLRPVSPDERDFRTPFFLWYRDEFENPEYRGTHPPGRSFLEASQSPIKEDCVACHSLPGIASFNSYFNYRGNLVDATVARPFSLSEMSESEVAGAAVKWKESRPNWTALRKLLASKEF
jgi:hypothetical protein